MNVFLDWYPNGNMSGMKYLIDNMNIKYLGYFYSDTDDKSINLDIKTEGYYIYDSVDKYLNNIEQCIPLDGNIISSMSMYEQTAMTLINRWRNTLLKKENYNETKTMYYKLLKFWNDYLTTREIELCFFQGIPHLIHTYIIYALCKVKKIETVIAMGFPPAYGIEFKTYFQESFDFIYDGFSERYNYFKRKYEETEIEKIPIPFDFQKYFDAYNVGLLDKKKNITIIVSNLSPFFTLKLALNRIKLYIKRGNYYSVIRKAKDFFIRKYVLKKYLSFIEKKEVLPIPGEKFIFFALHLQPEATTCPNAGIFDDQMLAIQMISKALPEGTFLYIKEHPAYWMRRAQYDDIRDYRNEYFKDQLLNLKNVRIINHDFDSQELANRSMGVASINGTIIWESLFKNKPALMFGNAFFSYIDGVKKITSFKECKNAIDSIFNETFSTPQLNDIAIFLNAIGEITTFGCSEFDVYNDVTLNSARMNKEENGMAIAKGIFDFYSRIHNK